MERALGSAWREWFRVHFFGLAALAVLFVGGLHGQRCPPVPEFSGSLKTGPFAYGDGALTEGVSLVLMGFYALGTLVVLVTSFPEGRAPSMSLVVRSLLNLGVVGAILVWNITLGAKQAWSAELCDARDVWTQLAWFGAAIVVIVSVNWAIAAQNRRTP